jgi:sugar lactone lactonase YvrE
VVTEIPGVIAAGQQWKDIWQVDGNNADGIIATKDGGLLIAQNDKSDVVKLSSDGKTSVAYSGTNTGGSLAMNSKGTLFLANRGLNASVDELAPKRKLLANKINGDSLDCIGGVLNDISADSKGGVYFTMGGLFYADSKGNVTRRWRSSMCRRMARSPTSMNSGSWKAAATAMAVPSIQRAACT